MSVHKKLLEGSGGLAKLIRKGAPSHQIRQRRAKGDEKNAENLAGIKVALHRERMHKLKRGVPSKRKHDRIYGIEKAIARAKGLGKQDARKEIGKLYVAGPKGKLPESVHERMLREGITTGGDPLLTGKRVGKALNNTKKAPEQADNQRKRIANKLNKRYKNKSDYGNKPGSRAKAAAMQYAGGVKQGQRS